MLCSTKYEDLERLFNFFMHFYYNLQYCVTFQLPRYYNFELQFTESKNFCHFLATSKPISTADVWSTSSVVHFWLILKTKNIKRLNDNKIIKTSVYLLIFLIIYIVFLQTRLNSGHHLDTQKYFQISRFYSKNKKHLYSLWCFKKIVP